MAPCRRRGSILLEARERPTPQEISQNTSLGSPDGRSVNVLSSTRTVIDVKVAVTMNAPRPGHSPGASSGGSPGSIVAGCPGQGICISLSRPPRRMTGQIVMVYPSE